jgi:hypothetical protein
LFAHLRPLLQGEEAEKAPGEDGARLRWRALGVFDYFANCGCEIVYAGARDDDGITAAVGFLSNSQKLSSLVLAEFHVKVFPFDLDLPGFDDVVHFRKNGGF